MYYSVRWKHSGVLELGIRNISRWYTAASFVVFNEALIMTFYIDGCENKCNVLYLLSHQLVVAHLIKTFRASIVVGEMW